MDSGRFLLAVVLMIAVMIVTNILLPPPRPEPATAPADSLAAPATSPVTAPAADPPGAQLRPDTTGPRTAPVPATPVMEAGTPQQVATADTVLVRSPRYEYRVSTRGAAIVGAQLREHRVLEAGREDQFVELIQDTMPGDLFGYRVRVGTTEIALGELDFTPAVAGLELDRGQPGTLEMRHEGETLSATIAYTFDPDRYLINARMQLTGFDQIPTLIITLPRRLALNEALPQEDERQLAYVVNSGQEGILSTPLRNVRAPRIENGPLYWAAVKNKYFVAATLAHPESQTRFGGLIANPVEEPFSADMSVTLLPDADGTFAFRFFMGPQEPQRLSEVGFGFEDVNPFGWRAFRMFLRPVGHGITWALYGMHDILGVGYGWVLVLFGVIIRVILWPLNAKAMRSQMKNMEIQPKLKEIQAKYKNEPEKLQKEMLRLYKEEGFNPMGGCLPMLIPLPILITMFFVFQSTIAFRGVGFLWLPDLSRADPFYILPVLLGVSMFLMQWLSTRSMTEVNPQMKFMMYAMPIFMVVIFLNFASGLNLYYSAMNFASIPQQLQIMRERKRFQEARGLA
ncbi:membrane protein insertase YidC [soil metagenome]